MKLTLLSFIVDLFIQITKVVHNSEDFDKSSIKPFLMDKERAKEEIQLIKKYNRAIAERREQIQRRGNQEGFYSPFISSFALEC